VRLEIETKGDYEKLKETTGGFMRLNLFRNIVSKFKIIVSEFFLTAIGNLSIILEVRRNFKKSEIMGD
jgi:hypothetical protein